MNSYLSRLSGFCIVLCLTGLSFFGCKDDDLGSGEPVQLLPYDAAKHIYGTYDDKNYDRWEMVIDPTTGDFEKIPGTQSLGGLYLQGYKELSAFQENKRYFVSLESGLILQIQDLETLEYTEFVLKDSTINEGINSLYIKFGKDENELYILSVYEELWRIDLLENTIELLYEDIPLDTLNYVKNFIYLKESHQMVFMIDTTNNGFSTAKKLVLFDLETSEVLDESFVPESFGYVLHPSNNSEIYGLGRPVDDLGYRFFKLSILGDRIFISQIGNSNLPLDKISPDLVTIHSGTNSFICRGGSLTEGAIEHNLYSIDLNSGVVKNLVKLSDEVNLMIKIAGE